MREVWVFKRRVHSRKEYTSTVKQILLSLAPRFSPSLSCGTFARLSSHSAASQARRADADSPDRRGQ